jgi:hypothetical protein
MLHFCVGEVSAAIMASAGTRDYVCPLRPLEVFTVSHTLDDRGG